MGYIKTENIKVLIGSWNVNAKFPSHTDILNWVLNRSERPEIIVVGIQEMISLSPTNVIGSTVVKSLSSDNATKWSDIILSTLNSQNQTSRYELIALEHMVGLCIMVLADASILEYLSDISIGNLATGSHGYLGNKGAVAVHMKVCDSAVVFVNCHFAAHQKDVEKRNEDYRNIISKLTFVDNTVSDAILGASQAGSPVVAEDITKCREDITSIQQRIAALRATMADPNADPPTPTPASAVTSGSSTVLNELKTYTIHDHDVIFWMGDLNYRLTDDIDIHQALDAISAGQAYDLLYHDQLTIEKDTDEIFHDFHEGMVAFNPTYKFIPGTSEYDARPEKKMRVPAWCDRILWRIGRGRDLALKEKQEENKQLLLRWVEAQEKMSNSGDREAAGLVGNDNSAYIYNLPVEPVVEAVELMRYEAVEPPNMSDHKPIRGFFNMRVRRLDHAQKHVTMMKLHLEWEISKENEELKQKLTNSIVNSTITS